MEAIGELPLPPGRYPPGLCFSNSKMHMKHPRTYYQHQVIPGHLETDFKKRGSSD